MHNMKTEPFTPRIVADILRSCPNIETAIPRDCYGNNSWRFFLIVDYLDGPGVVSLVIDINKREWRLCDSLFCYGSFRSLGELIDYFTQGGPI